MNDLNSLILEGVVIGLEGEVIGEPHLVETSDVLNFTVETTHYYKNRAGEGVEEKSQFKVVVYGSMCKLSLKDGVGISLVGRLKQNKWTDGDGVSHSEVQIVAEHIEIKKTK